MFGSLRKHSVKILVFVVNIALAAVAVFVIRQKDEARLLEKEQNQNPENQNVETATPDSFENSVEALDPEPAEADMSQNLTEEPAPPPVIETPAVVPETVTPPPVVKTPTPVPTPPKKTKPSDAKTKTS